MHDENLYHSDSQNKPCNHYWTIPVLCFHPLRTCMQNLHINLILYMLVSLVHRMIALYIIILCTIFWICIAAHIATKRWPAIWLHRLSTYPISKKEVKCTAGAGGTSKMFEDHTLCQGRNGCTNWQNWSPHHPRPFREWTHPESKVSCECCHVVLEVCFKKIISQQSTRHSLYHPGPCSSSEIIFQFTKLYVTVHVTKTKAPVAHCNGEFPCKPGPAVADLNCSWKDVLVTCHKMSRHNIEP